MTNDFSNYKFHCHALGNLLTKPQKGEALAQGTKTWLREIFRTEYFGRKEENKSDITEKGLMCEPVTIALCSQYLGMPLFKNEEPIKNDYIEGTPDIDERLSPIVGDVKTSYSLKTFPMFETELPNSDYFWQLGVGYAWLCNKKEGDFVYLMYGLVNTPKDIIERQKKYAGVYDMTDEQKMLERSAQFDRNGTFDDMPVVQRVRVFPIPVDTSYRDQLVERIIIARAYLNSLRDLVPKTYFRIAL